MNIHPIFVHFPIGLLITYGILEFMPFRKVIEQPYWFYIKATLVIVGSLAAIVTIQTGELAEEFFRGTDLMKLIKIHSFWAEMATLAFLALAGAYTVAWIEKDKLLLFAPESVIARMWGLLASTAHLILETKLRLAVVMVGIVALTIAGGLGAAIVYGPDIDPFVQAIYGLFF